MSDFEKLINASDLIEWIIETDPDWCVGSVRSIIDHIDKMPSAQPELCEDAVSRNAIIRTLNTMDRYVSEELTLCDTDEKYPKNEVFIVDDVYEEIVEKLPSAQPEIIRCNDCKHWTQTTGNMRGFGLGDCDYINAKLVNCNGFCYWAERRTDESD